MSESSNPTAPSAPPAAGADAQPAAEATAPPAAGTAAPMGKQAKIAVGVLVVAALAALFWPRGDGTFEAPGGFLVDGQGRPVRLATRMAPVTLVHFWATWCAPCITEIPALQRLAADFGDHSEFDLVMIAVDDEATDVEPFLGSLAAMALYDPSWEVAKRYGTAKLPETYLVSHGEVVEKWIGAADWDDEEIRQRILAELPGARDHGGESVAEARVSAW